MDILKSIVLGAAVGFGFFTITFGIILAIGCSKATR